MNTNTQTAIVKAADVPMKESDVVAIIKGKEAYSGRHGRYFLTRENGALKTVKLSVENNFLVVNGKSLFDMDSMVILAERQH